MRGEGVVKYIPIRLHAFLVWVSRVWKDWCIKVWVIPMLVFHWYNAGKMQGLPLCLLFL
jgi:hypothetical protein